MGEKISVCEVGPRDGLQMARTRMETSAKIAWIAAMAAAGVREIEVGSFVPPRVIPQMADTDKVARAAVQIPGLHVVALVPNLRGAQNAYAAGVHRLSMPISVSDGHSRANLNRTPDEQIAEIASVVAWAREQERRIEVMVACSTAFGCSIDGVVPTDKVVRVASGLAAAGVDLISLADTVGYGHPGQIREVVRAVRREIGRRLVGLHLHDTTGLGIANALAGVEEGIRCFDASLAGLGGCPYAPGASGNIVTEDLVFLLESMGFDTGIDLDRLIETRRFLEEHLPAETRHGQVAKSGIPKTFRAVEGIMGGAIGGGSMQRVRAMSYEADFYEELGLGEMDLEALLAGGAFGFGATAAGQAAPPASGAEPSDPGTLGLNFGGMEFDPNLEP
jgi:hydroxymethylglutaryl-CoA lyase